MLSEAEKKVLKKIHNNYGGLIYRVTSKYGIPPSWLYGLIQAESNGNPNICSSCKNCGPQRPMCLQYPKCPGKADAPCAYGLTQISPAWTYNLISKGLIPGSKEGGYVGDAAQRAYETLANPEWAIELSCLGISLWLQKKPDMTFHDVLTRYHGAYLASYHNRAKAVAEEADKCGYTSGGSLLVGGAIMGALAAGSIWLMRSTLKTKIMRGPNEQIHF